MTGSNRVTVQWSIIAESLRNSCHSNGVGGTEPHGYGSLLRYGSGTYTFHHNLYAHHSNRNPHIGDNLSVDWVNNVIYNWSINPGYTAGADEGSPHINSADAPFAARSIKVRSIQVKSALVRPFDKKLKNDNKSVDIARTQGTIINTAFHVG